MKQHFLHIIVAVEIIAGLLLMILMEENEDLFVYTLCLSDT